MSKALYLPFVLRKLSWLRQSWSSAVYTNFEAQQTKWGSKHDTRDYFDGWGFGSLVGKKFSVSSQGRVLKLLRVKSSQNNLISLQVTSWEDFELSMRRTKGDGWIQKRALKFPIQRNCQTRETLSISSTNFPWRILDSEELLRAFALARSIKKRDSYALLWIEKFHIIV